MSFISKLRSIGSTVVDGVGSAASIAGKTVSALNQKIASVAKETLATIKTPTAATVGTAAGWYAGRMAQIYLPGLIHSGFVWKAGWFLGGMILSPLLTPTLATFGSTLTGLAVGYVTGKVVSATIDYFCPAKKEEKIEEKKKELSRSGVDMEALTRELTTATSSPMRVIKDHTVKDDQPA